MRGKARWCEHEGQQAWASRVATGERTALRARPGRQAPPAGRRECGQGAGEHERPQAGVILEGTGFRNRHSSTRRGCRACISSSGAGQRDQHRERPARPREVAELQTRLRATAGASANGRVPGGGRAAAPQQRTRHRAGRADAPIHPAASPQRVRSPSRRRRAARRLVARRSAAPGGSACAASRTAAAGRSTADARAAHAPSSAVGSREAMEREQACRTALAMGAASCRRDTDAGRASVVAASFTLGSESTRAVSRDGRRSASESGGQAVPSRAAARAPCSELLGQHRAAACHGLPCDVAGRVRARCARKPAKSSSPDARVAAGARSRRHLRGQGRRIRFRRGQHQSALGRTRSTPG